MIALIVSITIQQLDFSDTYSHPINSDAKGYYAFLPAIFIYNDYNYSFVDDVEKTYYPEDGSQAKAFRMEQPNGTIVNKCFPGVALFYLPFFGIATLFSFLFGLPVDGYSILYQWSIAVAHWFYLFCALVLLSKACNELKFNKWKTLFGLVLIVFGTNIFFYVVYDFTVTHIFGFFGFSLLIWALVRYQTSLSFKYIGIFSCTLAILLIVRPTNLMMLFILPLLLDWENILELVKPKTWFIKSRWIYLVISFLILFLAPLLWKIQSGNWLVYSYGEEGFNFIKPHFFEFLFSYEKGWLLWSPIMLFMLIGASIYFFRVEKIKGFIFTFSMLAVIYVFSSWWVWTFGLGFGQRPMIDFYPIILLGFVGFMNSFNSKYYFLLYLPFVALNCFQSYQFHETILDGDLKTKHDYWSHFLQLEKDPPQVVISKEWVKKQVKSSSQQATLDEKNPYSNALEIRKTSKDDKIVVVCRLSGEYKKTDTKLVVSDSLGTFYKVHYLKNTIYPSAQEMQFSFEIDQELESPVKCYFWNENPTDPVNVKQFKVIVYQKK